MFETPHDRRETVLLVTPEEDAVMRYRAESYPRIVLQARTPSQALAILRMFAVDSVVVDAVFDDEGVAMIRAAAQRRVWRERMLGNERPRGLRRAF